MIEIQLEMNVKNLLFDSISKLLQELLIIFLRNPKEPIDELLSIVQIKVSHVDLFVHHLLVSILYERFYDTCSQPRISWQFL